MDFQDLLPIGVTLIVVGLVLAFGLQILGDMKEGMCGNDFSYNSTGDVCYNATTNVTTTTNQWNATVDTITGVAKFPTKMPLIATVVVAVVIIGVLIRYFTNRQ